MNELQKIYELFPDAGYDYEYLLQNPAITLDFIMKYPNLLDYKENFQFNPNCGLDYIDKFPNERIFRISGTKLSKLLTFEEACANPVKYSFFFEYTDNPAITFNMIKNNPQYPWCTYFYATNPNATIEQLFELGHRHPENYVFNKNLTMAIVINNPNVRWNIVSLSQNKGITMEDIENNLYFNWSWHHIFARDDITIDFIKKHHIRVGVINKYGLSKLITLDDIENNDDLNWCWYKLAEQRDLNMDFIKRNKDKNLDWFTISKRIKFTADDIPWNYQGLSSNLSITIPFILENLDKPLDWYYISENESITMEMIIANSDLKWCVDGLSHNPNLTAEYVKEHPEMNWDFDAFSFNEFDVKKK